MSARETVDQVGLITQQDSMPRSARNKSIYTVAGRSPIKEFDEDEDVVRNQRNKVKLHLPANQRAVKSKVIRTMQRHCRESLAASRQASQSIETLASAIKFNMASAIKFNMASAIKFNMDAHAEKTSESSSKKRMAKLSSYIPNTAVIDIGERESTGRHLIERGLDFIQLLSDMTGTRELGSRTPSIERYDDRAESMASSCYAALTSCKMHGMSLSASYELLVQLFLSESVKSRMRTLQRREPLVYDYVFAIHDSVLHLPVSCRADFEHHACRLVRLVFFLLATYQPDECRTRINKILAFEVPQEGGEYMMSRYAFDIYDLMCVVYAEKDVSAIELEYPEKVASNLRVFFSANFCLITNRVSN